ncbi:glycosyltransferase family 2 protein [Chryseobacterium lathyri]|uniref:Glycosyltransferase involved in cell wall biosynthesis n=1 Tax=Chryseobacterium lathyri TaxID=395933 RepID=A0ABT9SHX1_9FLAO|nr:glycosyltransferase [Chryseobacterium lathyri]MDP9958436.1 glycosyltransferase involved in cell wall biosynthesis [Chryseobacterium lathyri]MDQ0066470.1 glycosyltransferase involved in cell wall biosynthesis [Chryseobacterium lathyri]
MEERKDSTTVETDSLELSIVIPVYNTPLTYVKECLESIDRAQIEYSYEIIIVNDGSTDYELMNFLKEYKNPYTIIIHEENSGVSASRNIGLKQAKGDFLLCLDSDDKLLPAINDAITYLTNNKKYDIIYCDLQFFGDTDFLYKKCEFSKFQLMYVTNMLTLSSTLFRKKLVSKVLFNETLSYSEDRDFFSRAASLGFQFKHFKKPFCLYRRVFNNQSLSQKNIGMKHEVESLIKSQFNAHVEITPEEVNKYVINNFTAHKKHIIKLLLIIFFPSLFSYFVSRKFYKNNIVID